MNNKLLLIVLASTLLFDTGTAIASSEDKSYFGIQYGVGDYSENNISKTFKPTVLIGRFGYYFRPSFSIEGRFGLGMQGDTQFLPEFGASGLDATLELDSILGVYGTGRINLTESSSLYGVLGVSRVKAPASVPAFPAAISTTDGSSSVSYGVGADIGFGKKTLLNIELMRYLDKNSHDLNVIGVGAVFRF